MNHRRVNPADLRLTPIPGELYLRHLGVPSKSELDEPAASLAENAGKWYRENGHPWTCSRLAALQGIEEDTLRRPSAPRIPAAIPSSVAIDNRWVSAKL